ncbi:lysylphosphatidylglycerol synthase domain-containing protein [Aquincola sp. MAHUQ-54]|uniref:Lysylphosphatidylglycerol synthase domain-containing protein n=1 Tax=Aquincola agrisoli TaxID=3119538 RepID=A0AAW9Q3F5_9BURK
MASTLASAQAPRKGITTRPWWPWAKRLATTTFFLLVAWLIVKQARTVEWGEVWEAARNQPAHTLAIAGLLGALSHLLYATFDLLGRRYTGHTLGAPRVMATTFVSYVFNLNFGSLVGGLAFRFRLYSRLGLDAPCIAQIVGISMLTNWLGYLLLAGGIFLLRPLDLPDDWRLAGHSLQVLGGVLILAALAYLAMCFTSKRRTLSLRGHELPLPGGRMALLQVAMSCTNWMLMGGMVFVLLQQRVDYPTVLGVLLVAAIAGVITHVPAGLGVLEAVFAALLAGRVPQGELLGALLTYRAMYYLAPLALAIVMHLVMEARLPKQAAEAAAG